MTVLKLFLESPRGTLEQGRLLTVLRELLVRLFPADAARLACEDVSASIVDVDEGDDETAQVFRIWLSDESVVRISSHPWIEENLPPLLQLSIVAERRLPESLLLCVLTAVAAAAMLDCNIQEWKSVDRSDSRAEISHIEALATVTKFAGLPFSLASRRFLESFGDQWHSWIRVIDDQSVKSAI